MNVYAFTDIHGNINCYNRVMDYIRNHNPEKEYHIFFLGDACDRGECGYQIMKELLDNDHVSYLRGNHEDMFVKAAREIHQICLQNGYSSVKEAYAHLNREIYNLCGYCNENSALNLSLYNGSIRTISEWLDHGASMRFVNAIDRLPYCATYGQFDLCHAGCSVAEWRRAEKTPMIWDRTSLVFEWLDGRTLLHGHTPVNSLPRQLIKKYKVKKWIPVEQKFDNKSRKIDLDTRCYFSNVVSMYDLTNDKVITLYLDKSDLNIDD